MFTGKFIDCFKLYCEQFQYQSSQQLGNSYTSVAHDRLAEDQCEQTVKCVTFPQFMQQWILLHMM